jgi:spore germination cell wall hydrolase CwlJ-like protein
MRLIADEVWGALTVWMEARGESYEGKVAVAEVIQRRAARKFMSDGTIVGTVLKAYQFSGFNTSDPNRLAAARLDDADPTYQECLAAWRDAIGGVSVVPAAVFYFNPKGLDHTPTWASTDKLVKIIGAYHFYVA